ncbi:MAG: LETM1 domain-containing protein [bacterium]
MRQRLKRGKSISKELVTKIKDAVLENKDKVYQEIRETKELYDLMLKWSSGEQLTNIEKAAVKSQLFDICKTVPALAVFMVPFGSILLALLIKFLPFNILPTAFDEGDLNLEDEI